MKKLVFLHGAGSDKNAYGELMKQVAKQFDAELFSFNAPYPHPLKSGKFMWFNKFEQNNRRDAVIKDYYHSLEYIKNKILALGESLDNIILAGHSQGGGMAVHVGLELKLNKVISISGDLPYNIEYEKKENTPIYWFEGQNDSYINRDRKDSYKILQKIGANLQYRILPNSTHNEFSADLLKQIDETF